MPIKDTALMAYANLLERNGFTIYEPRRNRFGDYFLYSQVIDGQEYFGYIQHDHFGGYSHHMPIRASMNNGSSMYVDGVGTAQPAEKVLTIEVANKVAQPTNYNRLVGEQKNYEDPAWIEKIYTKRGTDKKGLQDDKL